MHNMVSALVSALVRLDVHKRASALVRLDMHIGVSALANSSSSLIGPWTTRVEVVAGCRSSSEATSRRSYRVCELALLVMP